MRFSGGVNVENIKNPILIAALLQSESDRILAGEGALKFAKENGLRPPPPLPPRRGGRDGVRGYSTVGACALDRGDRLAAAASTGGKGMERVGRVSDSALPAGNYANSFAAISCTGLGEDIVEESLASAIAVRAAGLKSLRKGFDLTFRKAGSRRRKLAAIGVDRKGNVVWNKTTEILYYAFKTGTNSDCFRLE